MFLVDNTFIGQLTIVLDAVQIETAMRQYGEPARVLHPNDKPAQIKAACVRFAQAVIDENYPADGGAIINNVCWEVRYHEEEEVIEIIYSTRIVSTFNAEAIVGE